MRRAVNGFGVPGAVLFTVVCAGGILSAAYTDSELTLDQANVVYARASASCDEPPAGLGSLFQTFAPGYASLLAVDLRLVAGNQFPTEGYDTAVRVRSGSPAGSVLGEATAHIVSKRLAGVTRFCFSPPLRLNIAELHVIEWPSPPLGSAVLSWAMTDSDTYAMGTALDCGGLEIPDKDHVFRTMTAVAETTTFSRGDCNQDGAMNVADGVCVLGYLFKHETNTCLDALDSNDDGALNIADAIRILGYLFASGPDLPSPFEECGRDIFFDPLSCEQFLACPGGPYVPWFRGQLRHRGAPIGSITQIEPTFSIVDDETGEDWTDFSATYDAATSNYRLEGLPHVCTVTIRFPIDAETPTLAGSFERALAWDSMMYSRQYPECYRILHLVEPFDNGAVAASLPPYPTYPPEPLTFTWEAPDGADSYRVSLERYRDEDHPSGYGRVEALASTTIANSTVQVLLPTSRLSEHYQFKLTAYSGTSTIGYYATTYAEGTEYAYRFKVK